MNCKRCNAEMRPAMAHQLDRDAFTAQPALECVRCGKLYVNGEWVDMMAPPDDETSETDEQPPDNPPDWGFYADADGEPFHILGDPHMDEKNLEALRNIVRAAKRAIERGEL